MKKIGLVIFIIINNFAFAEEIYLNNSASMGGECDHSIGVTCPGEIAGTKRYLCSILKNAEASRCNSWGGSLGSWDCSAECSWTPVAINKLLYFECSASSSASCYK